MMTVGRRAGRLVGIRLIAPVTAEQCDPFEVEVGKVVSAMPGPLIFCADLRGIGVLTDKVTEFIVTSMRKRNPKLMRTALLLPGDSAIAALQFERLIREAGASVRRAFRRETDAAAWLGEVMTAEERESLAAFIAEHGAEGRRSMPPGSTRG